MKKQHLDRKNPRLEGFNYSQDGAYFITICTQNRRQILSKISVGTGVLDCPKIQLLYYGEIADKYIRQLNDFYNSITVDKYVIMPDHIHLILRLESGQSGTPVPTNKNLKTDNRNSHIAKFVSTFKRFCNKEFKGNIWQSRFHDHIIRNESDYIEVWEYIENNPYKFIENSR